MNFAATVPLVFRQTVRSPAFLALHGFLWLWFLYDGLRPAGDGNLKLLKVGLYSSFIALYLCSSVLSAEYESKNSDILFLRGITPASLYWTRLVTLAGLGVSLVFMADGLLLLSGVFSMRGFAILLQGSLDVLLTCSLCFFFGSFVRGYLNAVLAFLVKLVSGFLAGAGSRALESGPPAWAFVLPPSWHIGAVGRTGHLDWHAMLHIFSVLAYCLVISWIGMMVFRKLGPRLLSG